MEIAHPVLHRYEYQSRSDWSTLRLLQGWHAYPSERSDEQRAAALYWKTNDFDQRMDRERFAPAIEPYLASHWPAMRVILAERAIQQKYQEIQELAEQLVKSTNALPAVVRGEGRQATSERSERDERPLSLEAFDPSRVWELSQLEKNRLQELTQRWDGHLAAISELEQLFLLS